MAALLMMSVVLRAQDKEAALGADMARQLKQQTTPLQSAIFDTFVKQVGAKLAAHLPGSDVNYTFTLMADDRGGQTHEPEAFPGGYISIPAKLVLAVKSEAEFAGMLAHAMDHVAERHALGQKPPSAAQGPLIGVGPIGDGAPELPLTSLSERREFEVDADAAAVRAMSAAGYDPQALADYIARVQPRLSSRLSALPPRDARLEAIEREIRNLPARTYRTAGGFSKIQDEVRRLRVSR